MAQTPEGKIKDWVVRRLKKEFPDAWIYKAPGGPYGRKGTPDLLCSMWGIFVAIEVKTETGALTKLQIIELQRLKKSGSIAAVIYGKDKLRIEAIIRATKQRANCKETHVQRESMCREV